jgi:phosphotransferase system HPr (HPr) family protein
MPETKATRTVTITNPTGIHLRSATATAALLRDFDAEVIVRKGTQAARGTDVLELISLVAERGDQLVLEAMGPQAEPALDALAQLIAGNFNELAKEE